MNSYSQLGLKELTRTPLASVMTLLVIAIASALPSGLYLLLKNVQTLSTQWQYQTTISLYLKPSLTPPQTKTLINTLQKDPDIARVKYISPQQGLADFAKQTQFAPVLSELKENPLPGVVVVTPINKEQTPVALKLLITRLKKFDGIDLTQLDMAWVQRLYSITQLAQRITYALALLFGVGVILIIGNTIRLTIQGHLEEIEILKLIGAPPSFIRRPILYRGAWFGLLGGLLAWILVGLVLWWLRAPAYTLAKTYDLHFTFSGFDVRFALFLIGACTVLGLAGAWLSVYKYLR